VLNTSQSDVRINKALSHPNLMPKRVYYFRILGMALGGVAISSVLIENQNHWGYWLWWAFSCLLWPHLAYLLAKKHANPFIAERRNLLADSFIAGSWAALMWFNLLPAVILLVITTADKVNSGIRNLWLYSQPVMFLGVLTGLFLTGFTFKPETSMLVIIGCLPIMTVHTFFVSMGSYKLVRKVQFQNIRLRELSQIDWLTQIYNRGHWQQLVKKLLRVQPKSKVMTLILIDIDHFKQINDKYGHSVGDDVLKIIAMVLIDNVPEDAVVGRLGGDEFAIVVQADRQQASSYATQICKQIAALHFTQTSDLCCSVSIGLAENDGSIKDLRLWFDQADKMMYRAKSQGRNQVLVKDNA
jgi:diguanylate cyclase